MLGERVRTILRRPFTLEGVTLDLEACVGIALYPEHGDDVDTLLQRADVAMYLAKEDRSGCELYAADRDEYSPHRLALAAELRRALDERELVLHYQPKADLSDGRIVAVEALVRWQHPEHGLLSPDQFVPLAEATGLIRELTLRVLDEALRQQRAWRDDGIDIRVAVNLSARDLYDLTLPATTARLLATHDVPPTALELEITESVIVADPMRARAILNRLSEMGVVLAIDDYGTGYSSLGYLKRLPIDEMKIDRSFVMQMADDRNDAAIVRSTVELGRNLGLRVVAEGVETAAAWAHLKALGCDFAQGYYLSKPVPAGRDRGARRGRRQAPPRTLPTADLESPPVPWPRAGPDRHGGRSRRCARAAQRARSGRVGANEIQRRYLEHDLAQTATDCLVSTDHGESSDTPRSTTPATSRSLRPTTRPPTSSSLPSRNVRASAGSTTWRARRFPRTPSSGSCSSDTSSRASATCCACGVASTPTSPLRRGRTASRSAPSPTRTVERVHELLDAIYAGWDPDYVERRPRRLARLHDGTRRLRPDAVVPLRARRRARRVRTALAAEQRRRMGQGHRRTRERARTRSRHGTPAARAFASTALAVRTGSG